VSVHDLPEIDADVTLENWQTGPYVQWSFQHVDEVVPTLAIPASPTPAALTSTPVPLDDLPVTLIDGSRTSVSSIVDSTDTDGWAVSRGGLLLTENYPRGMQPDTRHLLMSVSKSLIGMLTGTLVAQGLLDLSKPVEHYIPRLAGTGYSGATVRNLLDMRSGIRFSEDYLDPMAEVRIIEQVIGWAPPIASDLPTSMYDFLAGLERKTEHGGPFDYRSCEADMLGWLCEVAGGSSVTELLSQNLWQPMGAEFDAYIGIDAFGSGLYDGGICASLRDMVRFGELLLNGGRSALGVQVLPQEWVQDTWLGGEDSAHAFQTSPTSTLMIGGMYRNQCWFPAADHNVLLCLGIHGQMVYVNRITGVVAVKLSSWSEPQHAWKLFSTIRAFDTIGAHLIAQ